MNLVFCNTKGGVGKTDTAFHVATAVLANFRLIEIDDNNDSLSDFSQSEILKNRAISVSTSKGDNAFSEALFDAMSDGCDIIIDAGGGNDSKTVIQMILEQTDKEETIFIIPLMSGRKHVRNALNTYSMVKDRKVLFVLNAGRSKDEFVFWFGDEEADIPSVDSKTLKQPTVFMPWTQLFDKASMTGEVIADLSDFCESFENKAHARTLIHQKAAGNRAEFKRMWARYNLSVQINSFVKNELAEFKTAIEKMR